MAIFSSSNNKQNKNTAPSKTGRVSNDSTTIITEGSSINGEMELSCNLYVDGNFEGTIDSDKEITVGSKGYIKGEIKAEHLIVQGLIEGSIEAERIEIKSSGTVSGSVLAAKFIIEQNGVFEGESRLKRDEASGTSKISAKKGEIPKSKEKIPATPDLKVVKN